ncbi:peptidoglycan-binding domain-containing protein [Terrihabitans sp. B22-R8]|uniref:peptidoglycan-binding domain-containing protein n=1 Tax=Terrihabitans sp. B22-R8 TaxID=3425128 RepID=UPI00403D27E8
MASKKAVKSGQATRAKRESGKKKMLDAAMANELAGSKRFSPLDVTALGLAAATAVMIMVNALMFQSRPADLSAPFAGQDTQSQAAPETNGAHSAGATTAASSPLIKDIQFELGRRGIYEGAPDGLPGPKTEAAIRSFETIAGLTPTGQPSAGLLDLLRQGGGDSSGDVMQVQQALERLGFGPLKADGLMGEATRTAIRRFETKNGLPVRGEITSDLKRRILNAGRIR